MRDRPPPETRAEQLLPADDVVLATPDPGDPPLHLMHNLPLDCSPPRPWQVLQPPHAWDATARDKRLDWQVLQVISGSRGPSITPPVDRKGRRD